MKDKIIGAVLLLVVYLALFGNSTWTAAEGRLGDSAPFHQKARIVLLWPLYWMFRILAAVFWAPEPNAVESYKPLAMMPDWR